VVDNTEPADLNPLVSQDNVEREQLTQPSNSEPSSGSSVELMFEKFMAAMQQNNLTLQENINSNMNSVMADINTSNGHLEQFRAEVREDLNASSGQYCSLPDRWRNVQP
jgi:L-ribulose-5-phosphate 3-epimerase UlaE